MNVEVITEIQYLTVKATDGRGCEGYGGAWSYRQSSAKNCMAIE